MFFYSIFSSTVATPPRSQLDLSSLDESVQFFCEQGIAQSTTKTYQSALNKFAQFCNLYNVLSPFPVSEDMLCYFSSYLANAQLSPQTIKIYLSGIRHVQIKLGLPEPKEFSSLPRLRLLQAGIKRVHAQKVPIAARIRLPITPAILRQLKCHWEIKAADSDVKMLWAAAVLCFFGFFRAGELTVPSLNSFDLKFHLSWGDVSLDNPHSPHIVKVVLKRSKTDQFGRGVEVFVGKTGCPLCPVAGVLSYMTCRGSEPGPFFKLSNGQPLTKAYFTHHIRSALRAIGLPDDQFAGHSFRIGAATTAARAGIDDSKIRILGRWNSAAFLAYVRTPREELTKFSCSLAKV